MSTQSRSVFFYGGLINPKMLERLGVASREQTPATLPHHALTISPWVNVEPAEQGEVFGVVMDMTDKELASIYGQLKVAYHPETVEVRFDNGRTAQVACYVAAPMTPAQADEGHVRMLLEAAEARAFPAWYLDRIRSYLPR